MPLEMLQNGRYRILKQLGSGSMGEVYLVEDTRINRQVAIKGIVIVLVFVRLMHTVLSAFIGYFTENIVKKDQNVALNTI